MEKSSPSPAPFQCEYNPQFAHLLNQLGISLAVSTYQAGKVLIMSSVDQDKLVQLPRTYNTAMGMAVKNKKLAIASLNSVEYLINSPFLAPNYPRKPKVYDGLYLTRASYYTGQVNLHDMAFGKEDEIIGVNTLFSCLCYINPEDSFTPFWQPPFISELAPEDRCHLNGLAMEDDVIKYVSALGDTDSAGGWRENKMTGGIIMEYPSGEILTRGLGMPHSPRIYNGDLYCLNSTQGELIHIDRETGKYDVICKLGTFARGMDLFGDYLFIGVSKLRHNSPDFTDLPIAQSSYAGVIAVHLPSGSIMGGLKYHMSVDEIYDVKTLRSRRPNIISGELYEKAQAIVFKDKSFWAVEKEQNKKN